MKWLFTLLLLAILQPIWPQYQPDILGDNYLQRTFRMADDYEGEVVCTLVKRATGPATRDAILYVHGYNDYFFQRELGDSVNARGYNFYALDLRKYGRSLRPHQDAFFCKDLGEYFADIDTALATIRSEGNERIWLMGHSTGGLITSYYLHERQGHCPVDGLILNSPFLDWNFGWVMENILLPAVSFIGGYFPNLTAQNGGAFSQYGASLLKRLALARHRKDSVQGASPVALAQCPLAPCPFLIVAARARHAPGIDDAASDTGPEVARGAHV